MKSAVKIPLEIEPKTAAALDGQSKIANWLYNLLLQRAYELRKKYALTSCKKAARELYSERGLRNHIPLLKKEFPFLKTVFSSVLKNVALRLARAIRRHQQAKKGDGITGKKRRSRKVGWPHFRSWKKKWFSLLYEEPFKGYSLQGNVLTLSLGKDEKGKQIKVKLHLKEKFPHWLDPQKICTLRITKEGDIFYAIFTAERTLPECRSTAEKIVSLDPNHKNFAYAVDNEGIATEIANPYFLKSLDKRIDALKARRDRCQRKSVEVSRPDGSTFWRPSRRWTFFDKRLNELYRIRRDQTKTYLYTLAHQLYRRYHLIAIGDYTPNGGGITTKMRRAMNNQSLIGRFKQVLSWVAARSGRMFMQWSERGSTRTCHECKHVVKDGIPPDVRLWTCQSCGREHIRDENAAINGLYRTFEKIKLPCSGLRKVLFRRTWRFNSLGVLEIPQNTGDC